MRLVSFDELAAMPEGTIYSHYQPCICDGLMRKGETINGSNGKAIDWFTASLVAQCWNGEPPVVDDVECRHGFFDFEAQFAVYEPEDIEMLGQMLGLKAREGKV